PGERARAHRPPRPLSPAAGGHADPGRFRAGERGPRTTFKRTASRSRHRSARVLGDASPFGARRPLEIDDAPIDDAISGAASYARAVSTSARPSDAVGNLPGRTPPPTPRGCGEAERGVSVEVVHAGKSRRTEGVC